MNVGSFDSHTSLMNLTSQDFMFTDGQLNVCLCVGIASCARGRVLRLSVPAILCLIPVCIHGSFHSSIATVSMPKR